MTTSVLPGWGIYTSQYSREIVHDIGNIMCSQQHFALKVMQALPARVQIWILRKMFLGKCLKLAIRLTLNGFNLKNNTVLITYVVTYLLSSSVLINLLFFIAVGNWQAHVLV